jgi:hypothetical protein
MVGLRVHFEWYSHIIDNIVDVTSLKANLSFSVVDIDLQRASPHGPTSFLKLSVCRMTVARKYSCQWNIDNVLGKLNMGSV